MPTCLAIIQLCGRASKHRTQVSAPRWANADIAMLQQELQPALAGAASSLMACLTLRCVRLCLGDVDVSSPAITLVAQHRDLVLEAALQSKGARRTSNSRSEQYDSTAACHHHCMCSSADTRAAHLLADPPPQAEEPQSYSPEATPANIVT